MVNWFEKILPSFVKKDSGKKSSVPEGLWKNCPVCSTILYVPELEASHYVCPRCDHHIRICAYNYALGLIKNDVDQQCTYSSHFDEFEIRK